MGKQSGYVRNVSKIPSTRGGGKGMRFLDLRLKKTPDADLNRAFFDMRKSYKDLINGKRRERFANETLQLRRDLKNINNERKRRGINR